MTKETGGRRSLALDRNLTDEKPSISCSYRVFRSNVGLSETPCFLHLVSA